MIQPARLAACILAVSALAFPLAAQDTAAPDLVTEEATATAPPEPSPVVDVEVIAPPPTATASEIRAVESQAEKTLEAVAEGELTIAEATRDPEQTIDSGAGGTFWLLALLFGSIWSPIIAVIVEKVKAVDSRLGQPIAGLGLVVFYLAAWAMLAPGNPGLPQEWQAWLGAAFMGAGAGAMSSGGVRSFRGATR